MTGGLDRTGRGFAFEPFRLPEDVDVLYRNGEAAGLERQAVRVLRYLVANRGRVVTKRELLDELWPDAFTTESVLTRLVSLVRRELGGGAKDARHIRTFYGQGYQFVADVAVYETQTGGRAAAAPEAPSTNLPHAVTSFVGRGRSLGEIRDALGRSRLVTLVGPGGIGKTRLAVEAAREVSAEYPDGVWLVELASLADPSLVPGAAASVLGVREGANRSVTAAIADWLGPRRLLLVLDNCEHVIEACRELVERLLPASAGSRVLATSREVLDVDGEAALPVPALEVEDSPECEAVRLFVERARAARPDFALAPKDGATTARLCGRLEGIPLSIELAAARARTHSVEEILARTGDRFGLLARARDRGGRHRTLRATIDWSYDLLTDGERALLGRLSVFAGGCTLDAAEAVAAGSPGSDVREAILRLADKSLVVVDWSGQGPRCRMLETIREYAAEKLAEAGDAEPTCARHRAWFLDLAERADAAKAGPDAADWLARLETEHDNLRAALRTSAAAGDVETNVRLCAALAGFWNIRGHWTEGRAQFAETLAAAGDAFPRLRSKILGFAGVLAAGQDDFEGARRLYEECIEVRRAIGDREGVARVLHNLGVLTREQGDLELAALYYEESYETLRELGRRREIGISLNGLGELAAARGEYDRARHDLEESLEISRSVGDRRNAGTAMRNLGGLALQRGDLDRAVAYLEESLAAARELGYLDLEAASTGDLGWVALERGDMGRAREYFADAIKTVRELGQRLQLADALEGLACVAAGRGEPERALRIAGAVAALREAIGVAPSPTYRALVDRRLDEAARSAGADAEIEAGRRLDLDRAIAEALR